MLKWVTHTFTPPQQLLPGCQFGQFGHSTRVRQQPATCHYFLFLACSGGGISASLILNSFICHFFFWYENNWSKGAEKKCTEPHGTLSVTATCQQNYESTSLPEEEAKSCEQSLRRDSGKLPVCSRKHIHPRNSRTKKRSLTQESPAPHAQNTNQFTITNAASETQRKKHTIKTKTWIRQRTLSTVGRKITNCTTDRYSSSPRLVLT